MFENESDNTYFKNISNKNLGNKKTSQEILYDSQINIHNYKFEDEISQILKTSSKKQINEKNSKIKLPTQKVYDVNFTIAGAFIVSAR